MGGRSGSSGMNSGSNSTTKLTQEQMISSVSVNARWDSHERKVTYGYSFHTEDNELMHDSGYISKGAARSAMIAAGATKEQVQAAWGKLREINPAYYRRK